MTDRAGIRQLDSPSGLGATVNADGSLRRLAHGDIVLNLFPADGIEGGPANLFLRRTDGAAAWTPLLGPRSPLAFGGDGRRLIAAGNWQGLGITVTLTLAAETPAWFWHVRIANECTAPVPVDLTYVQDLGLAHYGAIRMNEYYVSQYVDHVPLGHPAHGWMVASRQNQAVGGRHPWTLLGSLGRAAEFATDALDAYGLAHRTGEAPPAAVAPRLCSTRRQHEHSLVALREETVRVDPRASVDLGFFGCFVADHPAATGAADLAHAAHILALPEAAAAAVAPAAPLSAPVPSLFATAPRLACRDLTAAEIAREWPQPHRHPESGDGTPWSFFCGAHTHVVLRAKEHRVLRPHGHLLRTGDALVPDEASLTTTAWMDGVFNSLVTQGHVGINRFLSTQRSYLGLFLAQGQRIFVDVDGVWQLLGVPAAWEATPGACRWLYAFGDSRVEVRLAAPTARHALELTLVVRDGPPRRFLVSHHVAWGGDDGLDPVPARVERDGEAFVLRPHPDGDVGRRFPDGAFRIVAHAGTPVARAGDDGLLFADGASRSQPYFVIETAATAQAGFTIVGELVRAEPPGARLAAADDAAWWQAAAGATRIAAPAESPLAAGAARLGEILPWFAHDALVHYLAPRGLEQFSGGGWGTRDVCQGPVEMLLALGRPAPVRDLLRRVFAQQNPDGDWPQWFMFFARERTIRPDDSHGDIVFWPVRALARYLDASGDATILDETLPFFAAAGPDAGEPATVAAHVERALALMRRRVIPGTRLAAYGHGDWNDSLQPVAPEMRERLASAWTVVLHHETLTALAAALARVGRPGSEALRSEAGRIRADFARLLVADGVLAGFARFAADGRVEHLLHPRDAETGIRYRLLPMIHAIGAGMLAPEAAAHHVALIREHLLGSDGARLFDRPPAYRGGPMLQFQRAESSTFFGREIGLMYVHAHLRWAEALAHLGDADAFFAALQQAHAVGIRDVVAAARPRQANCYYSSSDADVADRYEAAARYAEIRAGKVPLEGGWRVYSSGAGIAFRLIHECFLGMRRGSSELGIDPVIPPALDGLEADIDFDGRPLRLRYRIGAAGFGPRRVRLNEVDLPLRRGMNPYREPGVTVPLDAVRAALRAAANRLEIELG